MRRGPSGRTAMLGLGIVAVSLAATMSVTPVAASAAGSGKPASAGSGSPALTAPRPTSTAVSPEAPDPHPPAGGPAPDRSVPGGAALAGRSFVLPPDAPALPKGIRATSWILADLGSGEILAARDPHGRYQPASILKMLTAVTVAPALPGRRIVTISPAAAAAEGSAVGLLAGSRYTVDDLFSALMLVSGNDAAAALAQAFGGTARTVAAMNATVRRLGGYDTVVQTPSGLDGWQQLTSAYDMALVLRAALSQPRLVAYDRRLSASYPPHTSRYGSVGGYEFDNQSENFLSRVRGAILAKTGFTDAAQHTYLAAARRGGRTLGVVLLRDQRVPLDQFQQASALFDWGFSFSGAVAPVGRLAGPISATPAAAQSAVTAAGTGAGTGSGTGSRAPNGEAGRPLAAGRAQPRPGVAVSAGLGALLVLGAAGAAGRRANRRRSPRRR